MADSISVICVSCGKPIENVPYLPGVQELRCSNCDSTTYVKISDNGRLFTSWNKDKVENKE